MKNFFYLILCCLISATLLGSCQNKKTGSLIWSLKEGVLTISGQGAMPNYEVAPWDEERNTITKVIIGSGVETIGDNAFKNCKRLDSIVYILNTDSVCTVKSIGNSAFEGCFSLSSINIPNSVTSIGKFAFANCKTITSIDIPEKIRVIPESAFENCVRVEELIIPDNIDTIQKNAFNNCRRIKSLILGKELSFIGIGAFRMCKNIIKIESRNSIPPKIESGEDDPDEFDWFLLDEITPNVSAFKYIREYVSIVIPFDAISAYKEAPYWKKFWEIKKMKN